LDQNPNGSTTGPERQAPLVPEVVERATGAGGPEWGAGTESINREGVGGWMFGPRSFAGGRVQVYGCSPGCLIISLIVSVVASLVLTLLLNALF
jgi:hypothetical protein